MDQMPVMPALGTPAVPHGAILSYVTNVSTPTRVRLVASRAVLFAGVVEALAALFLLLGLALIVWDRYNALRRWPIWMGAGPTFNLRIAIEESIRYYFLFYLLLAVSATTASLHLFFTRAVRRGGAKASILSAIALVPLMGVLFFTALSLWCAAMLVGFGLFRTERSPIALLWFALGMVAVVQVLALKDVMTFLRWIAKNPQTERPTVAILPMLSKQPRP
jgi:hypothetical protein